MSALVTDSENEYLVAGDSQGKNLLSSSSKIQLVHLSSTQPSCLFSIHRKGWEPRWCTPIMGHTRNTPFHKFNLNMRPLLQHPKKLRDKLQRGHVTRYNLPATFLATPLQYQKIQGFRVADFATLSDERRSRSKIFLMFNLDKRAVCSKI